MKDRGGSGARRRAKDRVRKAKYRAERLRYAFAFLGGVCVLCGTNEDLQFDHWSPHLKRGPVMRFYSYGQAFHDELEKVVLLCRPCHLDKTAERRRNPPPKLEEAPF